MPIGLGEPEPIPRRFGMIHPPMPQLN